MSSDLEEAPFLVRQFANCFFVSIQDTCEISLFSIILRIMQISTFNLLSLMLFVEYKVSHRDRLSVKHFTWTDSSGSNW